MGVGGREAHFVLGETKSAELIILAGSRQHRSGGTQKVDCCDRVPGGPCHLGSPGETPQS